MVDFFGKEPSELVTYALATFEDNRSRDILELGCGQGRDTSFLVNSGFEVSALDYSEESISQMKERAKGVGANVTLKVHDARKGLPFPDDSLTLSIPTCSSPWISPMRRYPRCSSNALGS